MQSQSKKGFKNSNIQDAATSFAGEQPPMGDVKQVNVKTANKSIRTMRAPKTRAPGGYNDEDSDEMLLENVLIDVVGQVLASVAAASPKLASKVCGCCGTGSSSDDRRQTKLWCADNMLLYS